MSKKITIAVSGLNNTDNPGPGIPFIRAIKESAEFETRIIGLAYENLEPGIYLSDLVDKTFLMPYPSLGKEAMLHRLKEIHTKEPIDVLIPNFDAELHTFMISQNELQKMGILTYLPTMQQYTERHKENLPAFGDKYNIKAPRSIPITSLNDIKKVEAEIDYPLYVKGKFYDAHIVYNKEELATHFQKIASRWGLPIIIQERIKGTEVNVIALGNGFGDTIGAVTMRKQYITEKGKAWGGITIKDEKLLQITNQLIKDTNWRGGMELELIKTANDDYYMIEINPRLPAWLYLAVGAGQNLPEAMVKLALEMPVKPMSEFEIGKMFIRYSYDLIVDISEFQQISTQGEK